MWSRRAVATEMANRAKAMLESIGLLDWCVGLCWTSKSKWYSKRIPHQVFLEDVTGTALEINICPFG